MKSLQAVLFVSAMVFASITTALAQDVSMGLEAEPNVSWMTNRPASPVLQVGGDRPWSLSALLRFTLPPGGEIENVDYDDVFEGGVGLTLELDYMYNLAGGLAIGPYGSLGLDAYAGDEVTLSLGGTPTTIKSDDLLTVSAIAGVKVGIRPPEGIFVDGRLGIGVVTYIAAEADLTQGPTTMNVDLVDTESTYVTEIGGRIGYGFKSFLIQIGLVARYQGGISSDDLNADGDALIAYGLDLGIGIRF